MKSTKPQKPLALLSVTDKSGLADFARGLAESAGLRIVSTGGTFKTLKQANVACWPIEKITGVKEFLDGRVKTIHPKVAAGILARLNKQHERQLRARHIQRITLVCVNLYPFAQTVKKPGATFDEIIEQIDIGGILLLRAAAKNHADGVVVVCDPADYDLVLEAYRADGGPNDEFRLELAQKAMQLTATYDAIIAEYLARQLDIDLTFLALRGDKVLRKPENNYQGRSVLCQNILAEPDLLAWSNWTIVAGNPGHINICGGDSALRVMCRLAEAFRRNFGRVPFIAIACKHGNPCGLGVDWVEPARAVQRCMTGDKDAVMGAEVMTNFEVDAETSIWIHVVSDDIRDQVGRPYWGADVVFAPSFTSAGRSLLNTRSPERHLLANPALLDPQLPSQRYEIRPVRGGALIQGAADFIFDSRKVSEWIGGELSGDDLATLLVAWAVAWEGVSNSVVLAKNLQLIAAGLGQQDRRGATKLALMRAADAGHDVAGSMFASDGFFPFAFSATGSALLEATELLCDAGCCGGVVPADGKRWQEVRQFFFAKQMIVAALESQYRGFAKH
ncbi:MAG: hypothetical protein HUU49_05185 [Candidatus Buchananbacteria bacterium]|nr:hypothetical protein [Candidatus Buchananbacteria bacterium]